MNWDQIEGNWKQHKGLLRSKWSKLSDRDIDAINGKRTELIGLLETHYGHAREQAENEIDLWTAQIK